MNKNKNKNKNIKRGIIGVFIVLLAGIIFYFRFQIIDLFNQYKSGLELLKSSGSLISDSALSSLEDSGLTGSDYSFDTTYYPYYGMLASNEKAVYSQVYDNMMHVARKLVPIQKISNDSAIRIMEAVFNDHPEVFWVDNSYSYKYTSSGRCAQIILNYNNLANDLDSTLASFNNQVNKIVANASNYSSNYEKEKYVHDYLINYVSYSENASYNQTAYSALVNGSTVCAGYAKAFAYILTKLGIPTYYCTGTSEGEDHAWNIIYLGDGYYNVDVTWDDAKYSNYNYFNKTDSDFSSSHTRGSLSVNLPSCNATTYRGYTSSNKKNSSTSSNTNSSTNSNSNSNASTNSSTNSNSNSDSNSNSNTNSSTNSNSTSPSYEETKPNTPSIQIRIPKPKVEIDENEKTEETTPEDNH